MKSTVQLTSVGLAQAHPNNVHLLNRAAVVDNLEVEACECLHYQVLCTAHVLVGPKLVYFTEW